MSNGEGNIEDRLVAEGAGPENVAAWDPTGGMAVDIAARSDETRKIISLHVGHGLLSSRGAKTDDGGDFDGAERSE